MKKLIAMLLAIAIVASFGVTAAFAGVNYTNAQSKLHYQDRLNFFNDAIADAQYKQSTLTEVQVLWNHYITEKAEISKKYNDNTAAAGYKAEVTELDIDMKLALADLQAKYAGVDFGPAQADYNKLYDFDSWKDGKSAAVFAQADKVDVVLKEIINKAKAGIEDEDLEMYLALYTKLADKDAEKAAEAKAKAERDALVESLIKGIDTSTPAGKLLADATVAKFDAQASLKAAKAAADTAKKAIAVAQKGAYTDAQAAIIDAQAIAYQNMAAEINTAVADYVDSVYVAIADFYAGLN
jgi:hypothetical protein